MSSNVELLASIRLVSIFRGKSQVKSYRKLLNSWISGEIIAFIESLTENAKIEGFFLFPKTSDLNRDEMSCRSLLNHGWNNLLHIKKYQYFIIYIERR